MRRPRQCKAKKRVTYRSSQFTRALAINERLRLGGLAYVGNNYREYEIGSGFDWKNYERWIVDLADRGCRDVPDGRLLKAFRRSADGRAVSGDRVRPVVSLRNRVVGSPGRGPAPDPTAERAGRVVASGRDAGRGANARLHRRRKPLDGDYSFSCHGRRRVGKTQANDEYFSRATIKIEYCDGKNC